MRAAGAGACQWSPRATGPRRAPVPTPPRRPLAPEPRCGSPASRGRTALFTVTTLPGACRSTFSPVLPMSSRPGPFRPCVPMTIRSGCWVTRSMMASNADTARRCDARTSGIRRVGSCSTSRAACAVAASVQESSGGSVGPFAWSSRPWNRWSTAPGQPSFVMP